MAYQQGKSSYKNQVKATRWRKAAFFSALLVFIALSVIAVDFVIQRMSTSNTVVSRTNTTSVQSANITSFRSDYFQFQAPEEWIQVSTLSTDKRYVYYKKDGQRVTQRFIVEIDRPVTDREATYKFTHALPVQVSELGNLVNVGEVGTHCEESWPENTPGSPKRIEHNNVSFVCAPKANQYNVIIGEYDADEALEVTRDDGTTTTLTLIYSDLTAYPGTGDVYNIISSFTIL